MPLPQLTDCTRLRTSQLSLLIASVHRRRLPDIPDESRCYSELLRSSLQNQWIRICNPNLCREYVENCHDGKSPNASNGCTQSKNERPPATSCHPHDLRGIAAVGSVTFFLIDGLTRAKRRSGVYLGNFAGRSAEKERHGAFALVCGR